MSSPAIRYRYGAGSYHPETNSIYFHAGYPFLDTYLYGDKLMTWKYQIDSNIWFPIAARDRTNIKIDSTSHYIGSDTIMSVGGITIAYQLNDQTDLTCFETESALLNIPCGTWQEIPTPQIQRYRHASVYLNQKLYVFGGNDGRLRNDLQIVDVPASNALLVDQNACKAASYCIDVPFCQNCNKINYCQWCNGACGFKPQVLGLNISQTTKDPFLFGNLDQGLCPVASQPVQKQQCEDSVQTLTPGVGTSSQVSFGSFVDFAVNLTAGDAGRHI